MNNKIYDKILYSISTEIKNIVNEQFNISDIDFNDNENGYDANIFNKSLKHIEIYNKMLHGKFIENSEIEYMNNLVSEIAPDNLHELHIIVEFYSNSYPTDSMNWLDVSEVTDMISLFYYSKYNGDISRWDVSNVTDMKSMFDSSKFNNDISGWDVSNVTDMSHMFFHGIFNQDIS